jgi:hypothetical protein
VTILIPSRELPNKGSQFRVLPKLRFAALGITNYDLYNLHRVVFAGERETNRCVGFIESRNHPYTFFPLYITLVIMPFFIAVSSMPLPPCLYIRAGSAIASTAANNKTTNFFIPAPVIRP